MPVTTVFDRHPANPLLLPRDAPVPCKSICNPAAVLMDGETLLLARIIDERDVSHLWVARSRNGVDGWRFDAQPLLTPPPVEADWFDTLGCEDPRLTYVPEWDIYTVTYVGYSPFGAGVCLATTARFGTAQRHGIIIPPYDKDAVLFPRRFNGRFLLLHRPTINGLENIWLMESGDLLHWGRPVCVMQKGAEGWDSGKIGSGPPPIETPEGWLLIFHGAENTPQGWVYKAGLALLDLEDPTKVLARTTMPVFEPETSYERGGVKPGIVFPTGLIQRGDEVWMYYGAADVGIALATTTVGRLLDAVRADG